MIFKSHKPTKACMSLLSKPYATSSDSPNVTVKEFEEIDGTSHTSLFYLTGFTQISANTNIFRALTGYASAEPVSNYDEGTYTINEISGLTYNRYFNYNTEKAIYTIDITNENDSAITINSIKFTKQLYTASNTTVECLMWSCYLDSPITIPAGESRAAVITFSF